MFDLKLKEAFAVYFNCFNYFRKKAEVYYTQLHFSVRHLSKHKFPFLIYWSFVLKLIFKFVDLKRFSFGLRLSVPSVFINGITFCKFLTCSIKLLCRKMGSLQLIETIFLPSGIVMCHFSKFFTFKNMI